MNGILKISKLGILTLLIILLSAFSVFAQEEEGSGLDFYKWRNIGPANMGGRTIDIEVVENDPNTIYAATATGGLWKTVNDGITWDLVFGNEAISNIGDVAVSKSNPKVLYVGTGEANGRNSSSYGGGVYKSTDAGKTWKFMGLKNTMHIGRIEVHPTNSNIVYVAAMGKLWANNEDRGVFKSTNGGKTWNKVLYVDEKTGVTDLVIDPNNSSVVYAASYERIRDAFSAGDPVKRWGPGSGIYVSTNSGVNWKKIKSGLPTADMGRIGLSASRSVAGVVYAIIETSELPKMISERLSDKKKAERKKQNADKEKELGGIAYGGIFKSLDYGKTWKRQSTYNSRPFYYSQISVDPRNSNRLWIGGTQLGYTNDGGKTVDNKIGKNTHVDYHALWINPKDSDHVIVGSDGGINVTKDRGKNWDSHTQMSLAQFYAITADMRKPYYVYGGLQDNGSWGGPSRVTNNWGIQNENWFPVGFGDGFFCAVDPTDPNIVYYESQYGNPGRVNLLTGVQKGIKPTSKSVINSAKRPKYRFDWNTPLLISPHNPRTLFYPGDRVFKSLDRGDTWMEISPNLTNVEEGVKFSQQAIVSFDESPIKPGVIWAGTNDGNVWMSKDDGVNWKKLNDNIPNAPKEYWVKRLEASNHVLGRAYLVYDGHRNDDRKPYVYVTEDFGETWTNINNNLPEASVYVVREDHKNPDLLFLGNEHHVYMSLNRGKEWQKFSNGMPNVPIHDLYIHPRDNDLIVGTHGRGAWILDNIAPLQQHDPEVLHATEAHLFEIRPEVKYNTIFGFPFLTDKTFRGESAPNNANFFYHMSETQTDSVLVEVIDINGITIQKFNGSPVKGIHKIDWDLKLDRKRKRPEGVKRGARPSTAMPGEYLVRLTANGKSMTRKFVLEKDIERYLGK